MQASDKTRNLWDSLSDLEEASSPSLSPPSVEGLSQAPTFTDRWAKRLKDGQIPLFFFSLVVMLCVGFGGHTSALWATPLLSCLLCALLAPLLRFGRAFSLWVSLLTFPLLALLSVVALTLPKHFDNSFFVEVGTARPDFVELLQGDLEALFTTSTAIILGLALVSILTCLYASQRTHPWVRGSQTKTWRVVVAWSALLGPFLLAGYFVVTSVPGKQAQSWIESVRKVPSVSSGPRKAEWEALYNKHDTTELPAPAQRLASLDQLYPELLARLQERLPEADFDRDLTVRMIRMQLERGDSALTASQKAELAYYSLQARLSLRAQYQYIDAQRVLDKHVLSYLSSMEATVENLNLWMERIDTLNSMLPQSALEEWDLNAKTYFFGEKPNEELLIDAIGVDTPKRKVLRPSGNGTRAISKTPPRPLKFFAWNLSPSPTQIAFRWRESRALDDWARLRAYLPILTEPPSRYEHIRRQTDVKEGSELYPHLDQIFLEELDGRRYFDTLGPYLETARLLLQLREFKRETGSFPARLDDISGKKRVSRWEWSRQDSFAELIDRDLIEPEHGRPHPGWVLR